MNLFFKKESIVIFFILFLTLLGVSLHFFYGFSWPTSSGHSFASDDAFITYRYAQNFYLGHGIYFNVGEKVEGYSNFLYLLIMTPGIALTQNYIYMYSTLINILILFGVMYYFFKILNIYVNKTYSFVGISLVGLNPAIWANVTSGLETILILFVFVILWYLLKQPRNITNIIFLFIVTTLSILSRVDGFILPIIVSMYLILNRETKIGISIILYTFTFMMIYAGIRYYYYEDVIANTYYAKVSGDIYQRIYAGIRYMIKQTSYNGIAFYSMFTVLFFIKKLFKNYKSLVSFEFIFLVVWCLYMIYIGGDIYFERFLLPFLLIGIYYFIVFIASKKQYINIIALVIAVIISFSVFYKDGRFAYQNKTYDMWVNLGKFLKKAPSNYVLAIDAAGKVPYFSELRTIDMLGLNNKEIGKMDVNGKHFIAGHTKYDAEYTLSKKPDLIASWIKSNEDMLSGMVKEKYNDEYSLKYLINSSKNDLSVNIYDVEKFPKIYIRKLIKNGFNYGLLVRKTSIENMPNLSTPIPEFLFHQ